MSGETERDDRGLRCRIESLGGRRFLLSVGSGLVTALLTWAGKVDGTIYATVIVATVGAYIAGNTFQKVHGEGR